ncbi:HAT, C-terminal dimerisation domain [Cinara cedri]|uniref:HAT, C-terminal dimerisation domain n=1 Tax=Cinara cedri TaxID=506608 RepID=A0A5E4MAR2_9HEMI|nr:HAT, C-terminal dimerisation domain [Cinara cedri]
MKISEDIKGKFKQLVKTYQDIIDECNDSNLNDVYPVISKLLRISITLPASSATGERSFLTLHHLKPYLRNSSGQIRLNGLAFVNYINREINVDINDLIDELAKTSKQKLKTHL